ncbi:DUF3638 and DUF3645 domain-containing protein [Aspergillus melleus]|uniref:DUF3638 and DUF3645 domain-containing protein n=1 Tax=Aspergillus melleus TaxID=138277 RepID=UPI001E8DD12F|nr:uncharacterized protein LDX57_012091 [Aspergillus melleus]KAH8434444.1 hypothetical protein LDX57_012091 [Aspergillus melleus]
MQGSGFTYRNLPEPPSEETSPVPASIPLPDLVGLLRLSHPIIDLPVLPPPVTFSRSYAPQCYDKNPELKSMILELYNGEDRCRRELGESLLESLEALRDAKLPCSSSLPDEGVRQVLLQYRQCLVKKRDFLWHNIYCTLMAPKVHWKGVTGFILWPEVTVYSILSLLAGGRWELVPEEWKPILLLLGQIIAALQRSERLLMHYDQHNANDFFKEAESKPGDGWNPKTHPDWLLFEIQNKLTIREAQVKVAMQEIDPDTSGNAVLQLNMGEGKTSVITPLVVLALARSGQLPRVIVLKPLLRQSVNLLTQLGSMLNRPVYHVPFSRDTPLDEALMEGLEGIFRECQARQGILITLPEHILSFRLVGQDLASRGLSLAERAIKLETWLQQTCRNVIDESDEVLDPKFQLIYTVGHQQTMDGHSDRWEVTQALLDLVEQQAMELQRDDPTCIAIAHHGVRYPIYHFLKTEALDILIQKVAISVERDGLPNIPFTQWTRQLRRSAIQFIRFADVAPRDENVVRKTLAHGMYLRKLLVLRGLLAHQILRFVLGGKRWLVEYGLHPSRTLMAVPFRAKGIPSDNAEFGHPDVAVSLTCLSYYYHGLTREQVRHCFQLLTKENDPSVVYCHWVMRGSSSLPPGLKEITGVNLEDARCFDESLYPHLQYQKGIIDFYLSRVVFPREAKEFPYKLSTSAWDLPSRDGQPLTTGFSGTNDNRSLLPQSVPQCDLPHLLHTNAMVLRGLLQPENRHCTIAQDDQGRPLDAYRLIDLIIAQEPPIRVIIDVGAQVLEFSNLSVAQYWLSKTPEADGALFFDEKDEAIVIDRQGHTERLLASPFRYRMESCLVFLDQQHARGVDLKLPRTYRAAVTLGPRLTKDRLVQACSRMRGLGNGQSVMFICPPDVSHDIGVDVHHMTSADVIRWALGQTCASLKNLSPLWASQGLQYYKRLRLWNDLVKSESLEEVAQHIQEPEARTLSELYAPWDPARFSMSSPGHDQSDDMVRELIRVSGDMNCYAGLHEEQERQISHEVQREQQVCRPQAVAPVQHRLYKDIYHFAQHGVFPNGSSSNHIQPAFEDLHKTSAGKYDLPPDMAPHLYATSDFIRTIEQEGNNLADDFLKPVHWVLSSVDDSKILLLSQYEADKLIPVVCHLKRTTLHVYTPRTSRWMQSFEDLRFLCTGRVKEEDHVTHNRFHGLGLFAGSLYFGTLKDYEDFRHFLGLVTTRTPDCESTNDGFVDERKREEYPWPLHSPFQSNPLPFLGALCDVRSKGHGYLQTHVGMILGARPLSVRHF